MRGVSSQRCTSLSENDQQRQRSWRQKKPNRSMMMPLPLVMLPLFLIKVRTIIRLISVIYNQDRPQKLRFKSFTHQKQQLEPMILFFHAHTIQDMSKMNKRNMVKSLISSFRFKLKAQPKRSPTSDCHQILKFLNKVTSIF